MGAAHRRRRLAREGVFYQAPLYPYFLALVYSVFGDGVATLRFIQAVIGAGSCVLLAAAGMALFGHWGVVAGCTAGHLSVGDLP